VRDLVFEKIKKGCKVGFFGLGRSNASLLSCLPLEGCSVTLRSDKIIDRTLIPPNIMLEGIYEGKDSCRDIDEDVLIFSPSVRRERDELRDAKARGVIFTSDAELFLEKNEQQIFAVTGSDGKSTTTAMVEALLKAGGHKARSIGNIGEPMVARLKDDADIFALEASSFMLRYASPRSKRACLTNITPNHLDWHESLDEYKETKISLIKNAEKFVICDNCGDIKGAYGIVSVQKRFADLKAAYKAEIYMTTENGYLCRNGERLIPLCKIRKNERHNLQNLMMAIAMTDGYVDRSSVVRMASNFNGLPHRCELFFSAEGVDYIDSSIDTSPSRTEQTLLSLDRESVVILGGRSKGLDYRTLAPVLRKHARAAIITGENAEEIFSAINGVTKCYISPDLKSAVMLGRELARDTGLLLLSPASTSYDAYSSYAKRGDKFKDYVLKAHENSKKYK